ncbi:DUF4160 domain-containing protein [Pseudothauera rhizosphaerae]|uniref:DUF4160 domain-containing protein n=1 Tax=Pseudothauera rhizosphaerae TaxID=2565932 RepID=UPI001E346F54|nr:DUF4160 domain-containing protein [Pseudothauera rhizosphaerae]
MVTDLDPYSALFDLWQLSSTKRRTTTLDEYRKVLGAFAAFVADKPLADVQRRDVLAYRDSLLVRGQSATTANHKVGILRTIFRTAVDYELISTNPAEQVRTPVQGAAKTRLAFTADELNRVFRSDTYTAGKRPRGGGREAAFWLPLLALFTGARLEELAQLLVRDVHTANGLGHYLHISDEAVHAQLKNVSSKRRIPIHPILLAIGFMDYVEKMDGAVMLFPDLKRNVRGRLGGYFSTFFSAWLRNKVGITDTRKVFHSFRHTFKDACRAVGIEEAVGDALTGHTTPSAGRRYGNELYPLPPLFEAIERYEIAGLDLSHLYVRPYMPRLKRSELKMIAAFYGVVVAFVTGRAWRGRPPFVMAQWQGAEAGVDVASNTVISGFLPEHKLVLVRAWVEIHREELLANWHAGGPEGEFFRMEPLR